MEDWSDGTDWHTAFTPSVEARFAFQFRQLASKGLAGLLETHGAAKQYFERLRGKLNTPERVAGDAISEIAGLDWFLGEYADLPASLKDDKVWARFSTAVRS